MALVEKSKMKKVVFYIVAFLITGTAGVIISKMMMQTQVAGIGGDVHYFKKPWFVDFTMFVGMMMCIVQGAVENYFEKRKAFRNNIQGDNTKKGTSAWKVFWLTGIPGLCDAVATYLMMTGLMWTLTSVWQMVRGSIVIFTAIIRLFWLKKKIWKFEWLGIMIVFVSLVVVGFLENIMKHIFPQFSNLPLTFTVHSYSGVQSTGSDSKGLLATVTTGERVAGIFLVILAQAIQALQTVIEEFLLHNVEISSAFVVGMEGFWGASFCLAVAFPVCYYLPGEEGDGIHENTLDSLVMLGNSGLLMALTLVYAFVIVLFNLYGMYITEVTHSVTRNILEAVRTFFIWAIGLILHYQLSDVYGEPWTNWSFLELGGFGILCFGLFVFYKVIRLDRWWPKVFVYPLAGSENGDSDDEQKERPLLNDVGGNSDAYPSDV